MKALDVMLILGLCATLHGDGADASQSLDRPDRPATNNTRRVPWPARNPAADDEEKRVATSTIRKTDAIVQGLQDARARTASDYLEGLRKAVAGYTARQRSLGKEVEQHVLNAKLRVLEAYYRMRDHSYDVMTNFVTTTPVLPLEMLVAGVYNGMSPVEIKDEEMRRQYVKLVDDHKRAVDRHGHECELEKQISACGTNLRDWLSYPTTNGLQKAEIVKQVEATIQDATLKKEIIGWLDQPVRRQNSEGD